MKEKLLLMAMLLFVGGVSLRAASDNEVHANLTTPVEGGTSWDPDTRIFKWSGPFGNQLRNYPSDLPTGDLSLYEKVVVVCEFIETTTTNFRVIIYGINGAQHTWTRNQGDGTPSENGEIMEFPIKDLTNPDILNNCTDICLSGSGDFNENNTNGGAIKIHDFYLVKSVDPLAVPKSVLGENIAEAKLEPSFAYTTESFTTLQAAITAAETAKVASDATAESISAAQDALIEAQNGLVLANGYTILTAEMFKNWNADGMLIGNTGCAYALKENVGLPYGDGGVHWSNYADLSNYDELCMVVTYNTPRLIFNRKVAEDNTGAFIEIKDNTSDAQKYQRISEITSGKLYTIDLKLMKTDEQFAHLNCIKESGWNATVCITHMFLYTEPTKLLASSANLKGYKTFYNAINNYQVDENTTIYKATATDNSFVTLTEVEGNVIPKGTPVVLKTDATDYKLTLNPTSEESTDDWSDNLLKASDGNATGKYVLAYTDQAGLGFYQYNPALAAGGVYVEAPASAKGRLSIGIGIEGTTSIVEVESTDAAQENVYNVAGQKVNAAYKGIVIKNGKKYLNK